MTDLEERLAGPEGAAVRAAVLARLDALHERLRQTLAASVPRDDYPTLAATLEAVQAAREVLDAWPVPPASGQDAAPVPAALAPKGPSA